MTGKPVTQDPKMRSLLTNPDKYYEEARERARREVGPKVDEEVRSSGGILTYFRHRSASRTA